MEFEIAAKQVLASTAEVAAKERKQDVSSSNEGPSVEETASRLITARSEPTATIIEGWSKLDAQAGPADWACGGSAQSKLKVYGEVMNSGVLLLETRQLVQNLRQLRNQVAYAKIIPTPEAAQDYLVSVQRVIELIRNYRRNLPGFGFNRSTVGQGIRAICKTRSL